MRLLKPFSISTFCFLALFCLATFAFAAKQTTCPVMGGAINKELYADHKGQRVYFCCLGCPPEFEKNPEKYIKKMKKMGQEPETIESSK